MFLSIGSNSKNVACSAAKMVCTCLCSQKCLLVRHMSWAEYAGLFLIRSMTTVLSEHNMCVENPREVEMEYMMYLRCLFYGNVLYIYAIHLSWHPHGVASLGAQNLR